jgi:hypothetical protein
MSFWDMRLYYYLICNPDSNFTSYTSFVLYSNSPPIQEYGGYNFFSSRALRQNQILLNSWKGALKKKMQGAWKEGKR